MVKTAGREIWRYMKYKDDTTLSNVGREASLRHKKTKPTCLCQSKLQNPQRITSTTTNQQTANTSKRKRSAKLHVSRFERLVKYKVTDHRQSSRKTFVSKLTTSSSC